MASADAAVAVQMLCCGSGLKVYLASRADRSVGEYIGNPPFDDANYQSGEEYTYRVTAGRSSPSFIPGTDSLSITFRAVDGSAPKPPADLQITAAGAGAFLTWDANTETDLAGYRVSRTDRSDSDFAPIHENLHPTNGFFDPDYRPGRTYAVSAVDDSGNASPPASIRGQ